MLPHCPPPSLGGAVLCGPGMQVSDDGLAPLPLLNRAIIVVLNRKTFISSRSLQYRVSYMGETGVGWGTLPGIQSLLAGAVCCGACSIS